jgi:folate-dependent phosphoribosylglycinamide formyltransferase PurN
MKEGYDTTIALKNLKHVPSQDDVKRLRAKIQNEEHKYLPTSLEVAKRRGFAEEKWREYLGYGAKKQESNLL